MEDRGLRHRRYLVAAASLVLAACGDDPTGTNAAVSGSVSFSYTGGGGGSYSASGAISSVASQQTIHTTTWATGFRDNPTTSINVAANVPQSGSLANYFFITVGRQTVGSSTIDVNCSTDNPACTDVVLVVGSNQAGTSFQFFCQLESGTVTITSISNDNVQGTFSGSGTCFTPAAVESAFTVTSGSFNVPLVATPPNI